MARPLIDQLQAYRKRLQQLGRMREAAVVDQCIEIVRRNETHKRQGDRPGCANTPTGRQSTDQACEPAKALPPPGRRG